MPAARNTCVTRVRNVPLLASAQVFLLKTSIDSDNGARRCIAFGNKKAEHVKRESIIKTVK